ncbi:hypothetical protein AB0C10_15915 [Microbispora amethystogenes]|uniref:hypothetical protein n=1 Tax=Microbispora amethystogenes TaxID=1427754 RepID=UPI0033FBD3FA
MEQKTPRPTYKPWRFALIMFAPPALFLLAGVLVSSHIPRNTTNDLIASAVGVVGGLGSTLLGFYLSQRAGRGRVLEAEEDPGERIRRRIRRVNQAFTEAATLMDELRRDLEAQQTAREALIAEAERQQKLLAISQADAEKIREILVGETKATIRAERRQQWMFFALGVLASIPIGVAINLLVP